MENTLHLGLPWQALPLSHLLSNLQQFETYWHSEWEQMEVGKPGFQHFLQ